MLPSSQIKEVTIRDYLVIFKRRLWVIAACFTVVFSYFTFQTYKKIPLYQTAAKLVIERNTQRVFPVQQPYEMAPMIDREYLQSQINILTSRSLAKRVVQKLIDSGDTSFAGMQEPESAFLGGASVNYVPGTQIISISYTSTDPIKAAKFANALANTFIQYDLESRREGNKSATGALETQLQEIKKKLEKAEADLNEYMLKNTMVTDPEVERRAQGVLENFKNARINLQNDLLEASKRYKHKHPRIIALTSKIEALDKSIEDETKKLFALNERMVQYNQLKGEVEQNKFLYQQLSMRTKETELSKEFQTTNMRIIDPATVPQSPFTPNRPRDMQTGAMFGLILGLGLAFVLEYLDSTIKSADDVELYVKLPFLGYVPSAKTELKSVKESKDIDLICYKAPTARIAEAYRSIRTSIIFSSPEDRPLKTFLITSTYPKEGKTTVSINLATVFANSNERTVLVEADMRRPRIANSIGVDNKSGLSSYLAGASDLESSILKTYIPNLFLMPSGPRPPNPAELLTSQKMRALLADLRERYDRVIIDTPPVLTVADTSILANMVDGVILVVMANHLNIDVVLRSKQRLFEVKAKIMGTVLNNVNVKKEDSYYYYHYYYAEDKGKKS
jgi:polysaccharide biosynthesis transport protein